MSEKKGEVVLLNRPIAAVPSVRFGIGGLLSLLDLPSTIREIHGNHLNYKKEAKRLEVESQRIDREADLRHRQIDATLQLAVEDLKQRSLAAQKLIDTSKELTRAEVESREIDAAVTHLVKTGTAPDATAETRKTVEIMFEQWIKSQAERRQHVRAVFERTAETVKEMLNQPLNLQGLSHSPEE